MTQSMVSQLIKLNKVTIAKTIIKIGAGIALGSASIIINKKIEQKKGLEVDILEPGETIKTMTKDTRIEAGAARVVDMITGTKKVIDTVDTVFMIANVAKTVLILIASFAVIKQAREREVLEC